jgi:hypothetical protein
VVIAGFLVGSTAPIAAFVATKAAGGTDLHHQQSGGPKRQRRTEGAGYFVSRCKGGAAADGKESASEVAGPDRLPPDRPLKKSMGAALSGLEGKT